MSENGAYVTRAELNAHLHPIRTDLTEIKRDTEKLLAFHAVQEARMLARRSMTGTVVATLTIFSGVIGALTTFFLIRG